MVKAREDLTGRTFGRLTALEQVDDRIDKNGNHIARWRCKCCCGNQSDIFVDGRNLRKGTVTSCGCYRSETASKRRKKYNDYEVQEDYVIMYTTKGEPFFVDLDDFWRVKDICWVKGRYGHLSGQDSDGKTWELHRLIMNCPDGLNVDHIHGAKTVNDNRKYNLRIVTSSQNNMNREIMSNNTSGVTGVDWHKGWKKWRVRITVNHKTISLGAFDSMDDAIKARKEAEQKYFGEFSYDSSRQK